MKKLMKTTLVLLFSSFILWGCTSTQIYNVNQHKITTQKSSKRVYSAIKAAGTGLGWHISKVKPGVAQGKLVVRDHMATVRIDYNRSYYTIRYVRSQNLKYNSAKGTIHKNYNGWIHNLENAINAYLR